MSPHPHRHRAPALRGLVPLFAALLCLGSLARPTSGQSGLPPFPRYSLTELDFDAEVTTPVYAVNDSGEAGGSMYVEDGDGNIFFKPVHWKNGVMEVLPTLAGGDGEVLAINGPGQMVGWSSTGERNADGFPIWHAALWQNGTVVDLGTLGGDDSFAYGINDAGQIVGDAQLPAGEEYRSHACLWQNGTITDLGTLGGNVSSAQAINNAGQVVGAGRLSEEQGGSLRPFLWQNGQLTELGGFVGEDFGFAVDINNAGQAVGARFANDILTGLVWQNGQVTELPALGGTGTLAERIDDAGRVYGISNTDARSGRFRVGLYCIWQGGVPRPIQTVVDTSGRVFGISDVSPNGILAGSAERDLTSGPVLLTPTGLDDGPAAVALLALPLFSSNRRRGTGEVFLSGTAPDTDVRVRLRSGKPGTVRVPKFVTIPAGSRSATFRIETSSVKRSTTVNITATLGESVVRDSLFIRKAR